MHAYYLTYYLLYSRFRADYKQYPAGPPTAETPEALKHGSPIVVVA